MNRTSDIERAIINRNEHIAQTSPTAKAILVNPPNAAQRAEHKARLNALWRELTDAHRHNDAKAVQFALDIISCCETAAGHQAGTYLTI